MTMVIPKGAPGNVGAVQQNQEAIAVSDSLTTIATFGVLEAETLGVQITETDGTYALDQFVINARFSKDGVYQTFYSVAGDYTSPIGLLVGTSGDLTTLAASATGWFIMDCNGVESIQIRAASSNAAGSVVTVTGSAK